MPRDDRLPSALLGALVPAGLAFANGGYFATEWGIAALLLALAAGTALLLRDRVDLGRLDLAPAAALALLALWQLASLLWAPGPTEPVLEAERTLVYLALALAAPLVVSRASAPWLAGGLLAGVSAVAGWALATRLRPGWLTGFDPGQLSEPIGYWNALGILAVVGLLLAAGAVVGGSLQARVAVAPLLPVLAATLALTFSRGSWLALGVGLAVLAALVPHRLRAAALLVPVAVPAAAAAALAMSLGGLAERDATIDAARRDGAGLALALVLLAAATAAAAYGAARLERAYVPSPRARRAWALVLAAAAAAVVSGALVAAGNPVDAVGRAYDAFTAPLPAASGDLGDRLVSASGNGRADYWRVAWDEVAANPLHGGGAGSYERWWLERRPTAFAARDAHNLYLESLAELGPLGLALVLVAVAAPLAVAWRARHAPAAVGAGAALAAVVAHAAVDWDWEIPAVAGSALLAGFVVLASARTGVTRELRPGVRAVALAALVPLLAAAAVAHGGNRAAATAEDALDRGDAAAALDAADRARRFAPWSTEALRLRAEARRLSGDDAGADADLAEAIALDDGDWRLWLDVALGSDGAARDRALDRAVALNPRAPELEAFPRSRGTAQDR
ncbi:MAG TPA: O-antigen ligase family protein [Gaiellaceae bacterium]|nr:O-antigen ligase family protein [Gaiellaceae bacterium]